MNLSNISSLLTRAVGQVVRPAGSSAGHLSFRMLARTLTGPAGCCASGTSRTLVHGTNYPRQAGVPRRTPAPYAASERLRRAPSPDRVHDRRVPTVRRCPPTGRDRALATVLAAFATDPLLRWVWPVEERYDGVRTDLLRPAAGPADGGRRGVGRRAGRPAVDSVAMWDPPGGLYLPAAAERWAEVHAGFTAAERAAGRIYDEALGVPATAGPHWYLGVLATDPARQGTGLGRAVTAPMLAAADRAGLPAYLETASDTNLAIYRRLGFEVAREVDLPDGGPTLLADAPRPAGGGMTEDVLVVVAAGPGLGRSVALRFAREGAAVGLVARATDRLGGPGGRADGGRGAVGGDGRGRRRRRAVAARGDGRAAQRARAGDGARLQRLRVRRGAHPRRCRSTSCGWPSTSAWSAPWWRPRRPCPRCAPPAAGRSC